MSDINQNNVLSQQNMVGNPSVMAGNSADASGNSTNSRQSTWDNGSRYLQSGPVMATPAQVQPPKPDTEETRRMKENFRFFGPVTFLYAVFYAFCMYRNGSGVTFPFFVAGSLLFLCFSLSRLGTTLKRGSIFYMAAMVLLGVSTFCTDDGRLIFFNKLGIFLLMMSLLLKQFFDTSGWQLGKYLISICQLVFASFGELGRPISDFIGYRKKNASETGKKLLYVVLGLAVGLPLFIVVLLLLTSADAVFRKLTENVLENIRLDNIMNVLLRITFIFFASYALTAYLCKRCIGEKVADRRVGEPVLAITVAGLLTILYLLFCSVQIGGLFLGKLELPDGYTYSKYAREGFFQLLAVSLLNLAIVLVCMAFFKKSKVLKGMLTTMSFCTFIMIASSAWRMIYYIRYGYLTFLRILVLWFLVVLALLFAGVVVGIFREKFPLFRYSVGVVTILYLAFSFIHPDYLIAKYNVENAPHENVVWWTQQEGWQEEANLSRDNMFGGRFFLDVNPYQEYYYLMGLSADAAPILVPYLEELGYDMRAFKSENAVGYAQDVVGGDISRGSLDGFGYYWMQRMQQRTQNFGIRTFNVSRYVMVRRMR